MYSTKSAGKFAEGAKGPFSSDIMMRMKLILGHLAKKSMTLEEVRLELNTYFSDWFGTHNHVPSDAFRRTLLVDRMVSFVEQIRAGGRPTFKIAMAASSSWRHCSACFHF
jgi:hypothetical protein